VHSRPFYVVHDANWALYLTYTAYAYIHACFVDMLAMLMMIVCGTGTYCRNARNGGSGGATMRFDPEMSWGANAGLGIARNAVSIINNFDEQYATVSHDDVLVLSNFVR
jgi:catalase (peroxidase I)